MIHLTMVKINRIYTRTGDDGTTGLVGGSRVRKDSPHVEAYGDIDELNSWLGMLRTWAQESSAARVYEITASLQNELFDLGSEVASPPGEEWKGMVRITATHVERLEGLIDELSDGLPELRSFVLPGGSELNAALHIARTVCRRAERRLLAFASQSTGGADWFREPLRYLNRLSDLLFAMARFESARTECPEYLWVPGGWVAARGGPGGMASAPPPLVSSPRATPRNARRKKSGKSIAPRKSK